MSASQQARNKELHERINHLEAKLRAHTVRHLASMLNLRHTIEQLEDEIECAKFRLTDPARVECGAAAIVAIEEVYGLTEHHPDMPRNLTKIILAAADGEK